MLPFQTLKRTPIAVRAVSIGLCLLAVPCFGFSQGAGQGGSGSPSPLGAPRSGVPGSKDVAGLSCANAPMVVQAGHVLDQPGKPMRGATTLVLCQDKILAIKEGILSPAALSLADTTRVLDLSQAYVLPGFIDSHVHLTSDVAGLEGALKAVTDAPVKQVFEAQDNAKKTLNAGFTTVRNLGDGDGVTLALRDAIKKGQAVGPRILDAGAPISTTAGHMDATLGYREDMHIFREDNLCNGPDSCREAVRRQIRRGVDVIKIATTGGVNSRIGAGLGRQMFDDEVKALVDTAHLYGKKVAVHAHGADGVAMALRAGADSIEHGTLLTPAEVDLFVKNGAYYVPTLSTVNGYIERLSKDPNAYEPAVKAKIEWRIGITGKALRLAVSKGVKIAFGTDAGVSKHGKNADEFELMVKHGMTPMEAIKAATVNAADLLGIGSEVGSLEPGKQADLIAVMGDPLNDVRVLKSVQVVVKEGKVVKDARQDSRL